MWTPANCERQRTSWEVLCLSLTLFISAFLGSMGLLYSVLLSKHHFAYTGGEGLNAFSSADNTTQRRWRVSGHLLYWVVPSGAVKGPREPLLAVFALSFVGICTSSAAGTDSYCIPCERRVPIVFFCSHKNWINWVLSCESISKSYTLSLMDA